MGAVRWDRPVPDYFICFAPCMCPPHRTLKIANFLIGLGESMRKRAGGGGRVRFGLLSSLSDPVFRNINRCLCGYVAVAHPGLESWSGLMIKHDRIVSWVSSSSSVSFWNQSDISACLCGHLIKSTVVARLMPSSQEWG